MRILLIEDDAPLAESTIRALQAQGFNVDHTTRGEQAAPTLAAGGYDALVLDVGLPGIDGFEALRRIREAGVATPVLMLTARDAVPDRVRALDSGADDYLVKPFALAELSARLKALVRRSQQRLDNVLAVGKLRMDLGARRAFVDGQPFELSVREWGVLECLLGQQGKVVSKDAILQAIAGLDEMLTENAIEVYVSRLRVKLAGAGVKITTVRGFGYLVEEAAGE